MRPPRLTRFMEEQTVTIEKIVHGGKGLGRINGQVIFVPFTLPGETVRVRVTKKHRDYLEGQVIEVVTPSAKRIPPDCAYFGRCGGCQISHATYEHQLELKKGVLIESLQRNKISFPEPEVIAGNPFSYRHRAQLKYSACKNQLGFYEMESNQIVDVQHCLCVTQGLNKLLSTLRTALTATPLPHLSEIECYENEVGETAVYFNSKIPTNLRNELSNITSVFDPQDAEGAGLTVKFRDSEFPMGPGVFLQINPWLWKSMVQEVESHFRKSSDEVVTELYCGAGFFTVAIAPHVRNVYACEENPRAIQFAKSHHSAKNIEWICARAEDYKIPKETTEVLVDPPRAGLHKNVIEQLLKLNPRSISYVSCDPASFSRDAKQFSKDYRIQRLVLLDLFSQTYHFETIARLVR
jgi:23S rRNA (uracil1939-C5)-methyltransferase